MATIELDRVWIHDADDLSTFVTGKGAAVPRTTAVDLDRRVYAGGRRLVRRRPGSDTTIAYRLTPVSAATCEQLHAWTGRTVMVRDGVGRVTFGVYSTLDDEPVKGRGTFTVSFTLGAVSVGGDV